MSAGIIYYIFVILIVCIANCILVILYGYTLNKQNEKLREEIKLLKYLLKDRMIHVTHKIRE